MQHVGSFSGKLYPRFLSGSFCSGYEASYHTIYNQTLSDHFPLKFYQKKKKKTPSEVWRKWYIAAIAVKVLQMQLKILIAPHTFVSTCSGLPSYCGTAAAAGSSQTDRSKIWAEAPPGFGAGGWRKSLLGSDGLPVMGKRQITTLHR